jgi:poly(3-hydroxybutyrate) depolymerase
MKINSLHAFCVGVFFLAFACNNVQKKQLVENETQTDTLIVCDVGLPQSDTLFGIHQIDVHVKVPDSTLPKRGTVLLLHGWNLPALDWCEKTTMCEEALERGYYVVLPDLKKSNYQTQVFAETRADWSNIPGLYDLTQVIIPFLQEICLFQTHEKNFIVGLSTGGRGVVMVCMELPGLFTGAAALSGDFDQSQIPKDNVHKGFYGNYNDFQERWKTIDNPVFRVKEMKTPLYLGHGLNDKVTPYSQSQMFYDSLTKYHPQLKIKLHLPDAAHDYQYWGSESKAIWAFFDEL